MKKLIQLFGMIILGLLLSNNAWACSDPSLDSVTATPASICVGEQVTLDADADNVDVYEWSSNPSGASGNAKSITATPSVSTVYTLTVRGTGNKGCDGKSTSKSITVTPNPKPAAQNVTGGGTRCNDDNQTFSIGLQSSESGMKYQLYRDANAVGTPATGTGSAFNFGSYSQGTTYTVVATNSSGGCSTNMSGSATITVNPTPTPPALQSITNP